MSAKPWIEVRGIYGGVPETLLVDGSTLADHGLNALWLRSDAITADIVDRVHGQSSRIFAEFNSMHHAAYLAEHPDAAPVGTDGLPCPPPDGWQGICPTHEGYRRSRMAEFERLLAELDIDGIWLDYHHAHASWEQAEPNLPDTCFCNRCLSRFRDETGTDTDPHNLSTEWVTWRCKVFTEWVREYAEIRDRVRPSALLGTFHCPWTGTDRDGALTKKLAIDLRAQAAYVDVFSIMPYHARFGHSDDIGWISRQTEWLRGYLGSDKRIWPIVQLSDWGEKVSAVDVPLILDAATTPPSTGVMVFSWGSLAAQQDKVAALVDFYRHVAKA